MMAAPKYRTDAQACSCPGYWWRRTCKHYRAYRDAVLLVQAQDAAKGLSRVVSGWVGTWFRPTLSRPVSTSVDSATVRRRGHLLSPIPVFGVRGPLPGRESRAPGNGGVLLRVTAGMA